MMHFHIGRRGAVLIHDHEEADVEHKHWLDAYDSGRHYDEFGFGIFESDLQKVEQ